MQPGLEVHIHGPKSVGMSSSVFVALLDKLRLALQECPIERTLVRFGQGISAVVHAGIPEAPEDCIEGSLFRRRLMVVDIPQVCTARDVYTVVIVTNALWEWHILTEGRVAVVCY